MEERRSARVGTVSGLALLAGGTTIAAATNGADGPFATALLSLLTIGLGHALIVEIQRQAHRHSAGGWGLSDTINAVLLGGWAEVALSATIMVHGSTKTWVVGLALSLAYAAACGYFVTERRRAVAGTSTAAPPPESFPADPASEPLPQERAAEPPSEPRPSEPLPADRASASLPTKRAADALPPHRASEPLPAKRRS